MTNREKLYEIAGCLGSDADLAIVRAALLDVLVARFASEVAQ